MVTGIWNLHDINGYMCACSFHSNVAYIYSIELGPHWLCDPKLLPEPMVMHYCQLDYFSPNALENVVCKTALFRPASMR